MKSDRESSETAVSGGGHAANAAAAAILALSAALSLLWSHVRLMWNDEFLSFYGDSTPTLRDVWRVQLHTPISLDPPTYHLLSHLAMDVLGPGAMALRIPALLGFLLLQVCLFILVRRLAGSRAALIAMLFPLCTASFRYSVEGRPYGLLLGLYALALLCWYTAALRGDKAVGLNGRVVPLLGLAAAIALALTSHYFGVLIVVPVALGEVARTLERRRLDPPVVAAMVLGLAAIGMILPFKRALEPYQRHYYTSGVNLHNVSQGYRELFLRYNAWPIAWQRMLALLLAAATLLLFTLAVRRARRRPIGEPAYLWWGLMSMVLLPFFGYLFGKFVTHTMEVRYVVAALIPFAVTIPLLLAPRLRSRSFLAGGLAAILVLALAVNGFQIAGERRHSAEIVKGLTAPAFLHEELAAHPGERIFTQSLNDFFLGTYYAPDPLLRSRLSLIYDEDAEVHWYGHNTNAVTALYLPRFSPLRITPYPEFLRVPDALFLDNRSGWEWVGMDLRARAVPQQRLGTALSGDLWRVHPEGRGRP